MRQFATLSGVMMLLLQLAACGEPEVIRLGFIGGLEGRASDIGIASRNAVQMAVDEKNEAGGINGRQIQLLVRDDHGTSEGGAEAARSLVAEGVDAIIGPNLSVVAGGMVPVINEAQTVSITPTVSSLSFVGNDDHFYRIGSSTRQYAEAYARYSIDVGHRKIAAALDGRNALFSQSWTDEFERAFTELGGTLVASFQFDSTIGGEFSRAATTLLASNPDAIIFIANGVDAAQLTQQVRKQNSEIELMAAEWAASESLLTLGGAAIEGLLLLQTYDRYDETAHYVAFRDAYKARFRSDPGFSSIAAYDGATVLFSALQDMDDSQTIKSSMDALGTIQGLQQKVTFDDYGDSARQLVFVTVQKGKFIRK
ncbi:ABC transporter substrate-binding protein [Nisaea denitrificans]|uniref:ABC transporter substrate-binding protein n=1 Tax=Nisaea denitrificans TaxID=390877 RepID=UPI00048B29DA|nr:ABC transporter substrate-binding protein [Nisaea denitrificans]